MVFKALTEHYVISMYLYAASAILSIPGHFYLIYLDTYIVADRQTDRQVDRYFIDREKSHHRLICHKNEYMYINIQAYW